MIFLLVLILVALVFPGLIRGIFFTLFVLVIGFMIIVAGAVKEPATAPQGAVIHQDNKPVFYPNAPPPSDYALAPVKTVRTIRVKANPDLLNAK